MAASSALQRARELVDLALNELDEGDRRAAHIACHLQYVCDLLVEEIADGADAGDLTAPRALPGMHQQPEDLRERRGHLHLVPRGSVGRVDEAAADLLPMRGSKARLQ
ncbi:hypothetical protein FHS96_005620 [Sphingomonas zeicaulis]|uniref:hypothetical protein n=1 Tax=Sphingomonas zeicaulis TaxID=1632740 RepID=UPI003D1B1F19